MNFFKFTIFFVFLIFLKDLKADNLSNKSLNYLKFRPEYEYVKNKYNVRDEIFYKKNNSYELPKEIF